MILIFLIILLEQKIFINNAYIKNLYIIANGFISKIPTK